MSMSSTVQDTRHEGGLLPTYSERNKTLPNGITYQVVKNSEPAGKVMIKVVLRVGSINEEDHELGIAHFLEHVAFLGTTSYTAKDIKDYFQSIGLKDGAHSNATTSTNQTQYYLILPNEKAHIKKCLHILYEMIFEMKIIDEEVEKEKKVVLDEKGQIPRWQNEARRQMLCQLYPGQKYAERMPIGNEESIRAANAKSLRTFYEKWYTCTNLGIFIVGDSNPDEVEKWLENEFTKAPRREPAQPPPLTQRIETDSTIRFIRDRELTYPQCFLMRSDGDAGSFHQKSRENWVLDSIIVNIFTIRLQTIIRNSHEHNFDTSLTSRRSDLDPQRSITTLMVKAESAEKFTSAITLLFVELQRFRLHGVQDREFTDTAGDLKRAFTQKKQNLPMRKHHEILDTLTRNFAQLPLARLELFYDDCISILDEIGVADLAHRIEAFFQSQSAHLLFYLPESGTAHITEDSIRTIIDDAESKSYRDLAAWEVPNEVSLPDVVENVANGWECRYHDELDTTFVRLANGVEILVRPVITDKRAIQITGYHPSFHGQLGIQESLLLSCALEAFQQIGFAGYTHSDLSNYFARMAVQGRYPTLDCKEVKASSPPEAVVLLLQILHHTLHSRDELNGEEFELQLEKQKKFWIDLSQSEKTDDEKIEDCFYDIVTQGSPRYQSRSTEEIEKITLHEARALLLDHFPDPTEWKFTIVGHVGEVQELLPLVNQYLGSLKKRHAPQSSEYDDAITPLEPWDGNYTYYDINGDRAITRIVFKEIRQKEHFPMTADKNKAHIREVLLKGCAEEIVTIHLMDKIRYENSHLYGITVKEVLLPLSKTKSCEEIATINYVEINSPPDEQHVAHLVDLIKSGVGGINRDKVEALLSGQKEQMRLQYRSSQGMISSWSLRLRKSFKDNLSLELVAQGMKDFNQILDSIMADEVLATIQRDFNVNHIIVQSHFPKNK